MTHLLGIALMGLAYLALTIIAADIIRTTYRHYSRGNEYHQMPLPLHYAFVVAVVEVCWDKPVALHSARMEVVRRCEENRIAARERSKAAHPNNERDRTATATSQPAPATR